MIESPYQHFAKELATLSDLAESGAERTGEAFCSLITKAEDSDLMVDEKALLKAFIISIVGAFGLLDGMKKYETDIDFSNISEEFKKHIQIGSLSTSLYKLRDRRPVVLGFSQ